MLIHRAEALEGAQVSVRSRVMSGLSSVLVPPQRNSAARGTAISYPDEPIRGQVEELWLTCSNCFAFSSAALPWSWNITPYIKQPPSRVVTDVSQSLVIHYSRLFYGMVQLAPRRRV